MATNDDRRNDGRSGGSMYIFDGGNSIDGIIVKVVWIVGVVIDSNGRTTTMTKAEVMT